MKLGKLKNIRKAIESRPFFKNVLTLSLGTGLAQAINFFAQLVLIQLYAPEEIGVVARFVAVVSILAILLTGRYEQAIVAPKDVEKSKQLVVISFLLSTLTSILITIPLLVFPSYMVKQLDLERIENWLLFIPVGAWFLAGYNILFYWFNRKARFAAMANSKMTETVGRSAVQIGLGVLRLGIVGLMAGRVVGYIGSFFYFFLKAKNDFQSFFQALNWRELKKTAREFIHFPKHLLISEGIAAFYFQLPLLYLGWRYSDEAVGYYSTAAMFVNIPSILIARAVGDVFRQRAAELYIEKGRFDDLVRSTLRHTFRIAIVPFLLLAVISPFAFKWYNPLWEQTGWYVAVLTFSNFFSFVITPLDKSSYVVQKTGYLFYWHISRCLFYILAGELAKVMNVTPLTYLWFIGFVDVAHYLVDLRFSFKFSKGH